MLTAMNVEAQVIHVPTGAQDYRPALYGGVSAVELDATGVRRVKLNVSAAELSERVVVAYTGASRNSGINNWDVMKRRIDGDPAVIAAFNGIRDAAVGMRAALSAHDWAAARPPPERRMAAAARSSRRGSPRPRSTRCWPPPGGPAPRAARSAAPDGGGCLFCLTEPAAVLLLATAGAAVSRSPSLNNGLLIERG